MGNNSLLMLVLYAGAFIGIFYFLLIRPQQRQRRAHEALVSGIKPGDKVVTAGGIYGTVKRTESDTVVLTVAKGVDIKVARRAVAEVAREGATPTTEAKAESAAKQLEEPAEEKAEEKAEAPTEERAGSESDAPEKADSEPTA